MTCPHCEKPLDKHPVNICLIKWAAECAGWTNIKIVDGRLAGDNPQKDAGPRWGNQQFIPHYSTNIEAAMMLVKAMREQHPVCVFYLYIGPLGAVATFTKPWDVGNLPKAKPTAQEAITRAYIAAKGANE